MREENLQYKCKDSVNINDYNVTDNIPNDLDEFNIIFKKSSSIESLIHKLKNKNINCQSLKLMFPNISQYLNQLLKYVNIKDKGTLKLLNITNDTEESVNFINISSNNINKLVIDEIYNHNKTNYIFINVEDAAKLEEIQIDFTSDQLQKYVNLHIFIIGKNQKMDIIISNGKSKSSAHVKTCNINHSTNTIQKITKEEFENEIKQALSTGYKVYGEHNGEVNQSIIKWLIVLIIITLLILSFVNSNQKDLIDALDENI